MEGKVLKKKIIFLSTLSLIIILIGGCGEKTVSEETNEIVETEDNAVLNNTDIQHEQLDYSFPVGEEAFDLSVNGVKVELGKTIREIMEDLNAQTFYYDEKNVTAKQSGGLYAQLDDTGYSVLSISGYNESGETVYNSDTKSYYISTDILNNRDAFIKFKDDIVFGSTYERIIEVYGEPLIEDDIVFKDQFNSLGGQSTAEFCEENGIPLEYGDKGKFLKYRNGENTYMEFMIFENTGLSLFNMYFDIGQL